MIYRISKSNPQLKNILWTGLVPEYGFDKHAILKTAVNTDHSEVFFEIVDQDAVNVSFAKKWFTSLRAISLTATATPALVVMLAGVLVDGARPDFVSFWLSFFSVLFLQIAVNVLNDVEDHVNLVDAPGDVGGSGVIQRGWISARVLARFGYRSLALGVAFGLYPFIIHIDLLWPVALLSLIGVIGYSGSPFRFKYRALGDCVVFLLCGPFLVFGFSEVTFGKFGFLAAMIGSVFGLAATGILHANNLNDLEVDLSRGARTIANRIGFQSSKRYLYLIYAFISVLLLLSAAIQKVPLWFAFVPFLVTPIVVRMLLKVKEASGPLSPAILKIRFEAAQIHLSIGLCWLVASGIDLGWWSH